jgi:hypothetical protein
MSASSFGGLWTYPSTAFPQHDDFMFIDEERGRIITFVVIESDPLVRAPMRNWYRPVSATSISARLRPTDPWRVHEFRLEDDCLFWNCGGEVQSWRGVPWERRPDWLDARLAGEYSKMDATDQCA